MKSPGHQKWPEHAVRESRLAGKARVEVDGEIIAESDDVIRVEEDGYPPRLYFPRSGVAMGRLSGETSTRTHCAFKGDARYFNLLGGQGPLQDAVWSYEQPFDEHRALKDRLAFYDDKYPRIRITAYS